MNHPSPTRPPAGKRDPMTASTRRPDLITWRGPHGIEVCLNEEMIFLRYSGTRTLTLEESEITALVMLINDVADHRARGTVPIPVATEMPF